jgi:thermitase
VIKTITAIGVDVVKVLAGTVQDKIKIYLRNPNVRYAEPNYLRPLIMPIEGQFSPSIKVFDEQWSLHNNGNGLQTYVDPATGVPEWNLTFLDSDIDAPEAWELSTGDSAVKVAVVDSGVECGHPDLAGKCIDNEDHVSVDFDSFGNPIPELIDQAGHGTDVASIIAMNTNNGQGGAGVGWNTSIGSFKVCYLEQIIPGFPVGSSLRGMRSLQKGLIAMLNLRDV